MPLKRSNEEDTSASSESELDEQEFTTPWAQHGQRWGHPWHAMCSYLGTFPASLARGMISLFSSTGDVIMDPFSGRGTTLLEGRILNRTALVSDLNPMAIALSRAKNADVTLDQALSEIETLRGSFDRLMYLPEAHVQHDDIQLIYSPETLAQLCYLRRRLVKSDTDVRAFLLGALLGVMHGAERQDGTSAYASISMPNTFSMAPNYVRRFVETRQLNRIGRDVFAILAEKVERLYKIDPPRGHKGIVSVCDAKQLAHNSDLVDYRETVRLVVTSPPYLGVVNYAKQNWIRNWLLEPADYFGRESGLDDNLTLPAWLDFIETTIEQLKTFLRPDGVVVLVVGDVASTKSHINLARHLIQRMLHDKVFSYIGVFDDYIGHDIKTTRIWKETKGKATATDRIIVLSNSEPRFNFTEMAGCLGLAEESSSLHRGIDAATLAENARLMAGVK
ncbi:MAG: site-specific DNA-methyltransferase [Burkholderiales bacterium]|nr:site-specific DNA-methyltransferase [Burkholderiales bacterium]